MLKPFVTKPNNLPLALRRVTACHHVARWRDFAQEEEAGQREQPGGDPERRQELRNQCGAE
jgi:hypothetical protein